MFNKKKENELKIECPECFEENIVSLSSDIKCKKCEKSLTGQKYKSVLLSAGLVFSLGAGLGVTSDAYLNINRASVKTEYKMMKTCINRFGNNSEVRDDCACAVESMLGVIDAQKARFYSTSWLKDVLKEKYNECRY